MYFVRVEDKLCVGVVGRLATGYSDDGGSWGAHGQLIQRPQILPRHRLRMPKPVLVFRRALEHLERIAMFLLVHNLYGALLILGLATQGAAQT